MSLAVGVDLGGTHLRAALVETSAERPTPLHEERLPTGEDRVPERVADLIASAVGRVCTRAEGPVAGVGIGIAAMLRGQSGVVANAPNLGWREVDFRSLVRARLGQRVELYNDLKAIAWGEHRYGAGKGAPNVVCVYFGTGIGGGIVVGGELYYGAGNLAGEIGHTKVVTGGAARLCGCGQHGCIEAYAGGANLAARVRAELAAGAQSQALAFAGGEVAKVHPGHVDQAARAGDPYARRLWTEIAPLIGMALANACTLFNPNRLILGGGMWEGTPELRRLSEATLPELINAPTQETLTVCETSLGDLAGMLGAADLISR
ncbi:MAG TPA: ROK family protein [Polyangia bacterium]|nr:ROK family protein [Polyangia bacterium]